MNSDEKLSQPTPTVLACASHSPLMYCFKRPPAGHERVEKAFADVAERIAAFDPEIVFMFGPDHYTSLFQQLAPPFTIPTAAVAIDDIGGHPGPLDVPKDVVLDLISYLAVGGVDVAVSHAFSVDHGISQSLHRLNGDIARYPVVPIIINTMTAPLPPYFRSRKLGELVGAFVRERGIRALFMSSGGLSHNPKVIYPDVGTGPDEVTSWQRKGKGSELMSVDAWLERHETMHHVAAQMFVDGEITAEDCCFNEEFDRMAINILENGKLESMDDWRNDEVIEKGGIGAVEIHGWLAASAAHQAAGGQLPKCEIYEHALEYGIAVGILYGAATT
jgi:2,3-dihydroxyphenylpropionate 1,2-dioxygenase